MGGPCPISGRPGSAKRMFAPFDRGGNPDHNGFKHVLDEFGRQSASPFPKDLDGTWVKPSASFVSYRH
jgi:hypothetical protein